jgi:hypothetical protein
MAKDASARWLSAGDLGRAALAAAEHRAIAEPERSVARGEAAPAQTAPTTTAAGLTRTAQGRPGLPAAAGGATNRPGNTSASADGEPPDAPKRRRVLLIGGALALVAAALVAVVLITGGGSDSSNATGERTSSGNDPGTAGSEAPDALTIAGAINSANTFADAFSDARLDNLEALFTKEGFEQTDTRETCSGADQPMSLDAALADYNCIWQIRQADMELSAIRVDTGERTLTASYTTVFEGSETGSGKVTLHLVPVKDANPLIDRIAYSEG